MFDPSSSVSSWRFLPRLNRVKCWVIHRYCVYLWGFTLFFCDSYMSSLAFYFLFQLKRLLFLGSWTQNIVKVIFNYRVSFHRQVLATNSVQKLDFFLSPTAGINRVQHSVLYLHTWVLIITPILHHYGLVSECTFKILVLFDRIIQFLPYLVRPVLRTNGWPKLVSSCSGSHARTRLN
jgi:hypothetical protein